MSQEVKLLQRHARTGATFADWRAREHVVFEGFKFHGERELDLWAKAGIKHVIVGLTDEDDDKRGIDPSDLDDVFKWRHGKSGKSRFIKHARLCAERGMWAWPMIWLRTTLGYNVTASQEILPLTDEDGCGPILFNTERYWHKLLPEGMSHYTAVQEHVVPHWCEQGVALGVTDYASCPESILPLLSICDFGLAQAYSRASWAKRQGKANEVYLPGRTQDFAEVKWLRRMSHDQALIMGLAAYDQAGHRGGTRAAMTASRDASDAQGVAGVAWWSWPSAGSTAKKVILDLARQDHGLVEVG